MESAAITRRTGRKLEVGDHLIIDGGERTALVVSTGNGFYGEKVARLRVEGGPANGREVEIGLGLGTRYEVVA